ncbi:MAG: PLP-dependent transferase [Alphaproteobacteria bacterium]|nr:MAG: PLP-dependent transferase [Alphaproteobacteria bacterium]
MKDDDRPRNYRKDTLLTHLGRNPEAQHGAINPPVYHASTILSKNVAEWENRRDPRVHFGVVRYGLSGTPTTFALEELLAKIEGGYRAAIVCSGLAAITAPLQGLLSQGDNILMVDSAYGPARNFCNREDVPAIAAVAHSRGAKVVMDNTWATPYLFRSFEHGVDVSIHAATKYIGGHSDVMLGAVITNEESWLPVRSMIADLGHCAGPDDIIFGLRGMRTLSVRLERHQKNATEVARWLQSRPEVSRVLYPALPEDPGYALWKRDFLGASGLFGVVLKAVPKAAVDAFVESLDLFGIGASWGGYESLIQPSYPERSRTATRWQAEGPLVRIHIGLEDPQDLIADLAQGLDRLRTVAAA